MPSGKGKAKKTSHEIFQRIEQAMSELQGMKEEEKRKKRMREAYESGNDNGGNGTDTIDSMGEDEEAVEKAAETEEGKLIGHKVSYWCYVCGQDLKTSKAYEDHMTNQRNSTDGGKACARRQQPNKKMHKRDERERRTAEFTPPNTSAAHASSNWSKVAFRENLAAREIG